VSRAAALPAAGAGKDERRRRPGTGVGASEPCRHATWRRRGRGRAPRDGLAQGRGLASRAPPHGLAQARARTSAGAGLRPSAAAWFVCDFFSRF